MIFATHDEIGFSQLRPSYDSINVGHIGSTFEATTFYVSQDKKTIATDSKIRKQWEEKI